MTTTTTTKKAYQNGLSRTDYLAKARNYCRNRFNIHCADNPWSHDSFNASKALEDTENRYIDLNTCGVEGDCALNGENNIDIQYLNTGDTYDSTIVFWKGRFLVASWGDIVESICY